MTMRLDTKHARIGALIRALRDDRCGPIMIRHKGGLARNIRCGAFLARVVEEAGSQSEFPNGTEKGRVDRSRMGA